MKHYLKHSIIELAKKLERMERKPVAIVARTLYLPLLICFAVLIRFIEGLGAVWQSRHEVKQWILTGETF